MNKKVDLLIIGGGSAGMAAAIQAYKDGVKDILIVEKESSLGGILNQCIHAGFGLTEFKEELTGPEYLQRFVDQINELHIPYVLDSYVMFITPNKVVNYASKTEGIVHVEAKAIIFATGCYERNAGAIKLPGDRCSGVITAGTAQKLLNIHGYLCGKRIVILGSGDIGLIMARRLTLEGAKVLCVSEIMPYSNGLNRNIQQCLIDYDIPLYLSKTVSKVVGKDRLEKVILSDVDDKLQVIPNTEMEIECDTLILSVGLVPYISILEYMGVPLSSTKGAKVNEHMETMVEGIFSCGNCLHVHDVVDFVSDEGRQAGHGAALYIQDKLESSLNVSVIPGNGINYVLPQVVNTSNTEDVTFKFRVKKPINDVFVVIKSGDTLLAKKFESALIPSEMVLIKVNKDKIINLSSDITVSLESRA